jgi:hypothetical protein
LISPDTHPTEETKKKKYKNKTFITLTWRKDNRALVRQAPGVSQSHTKTESVTKAKGPDDLEFWTRQSFEGKGYRGPDLARSHWAQHFKVPEKSHHGFPGSSLEQARL